MVGYDDLKKMWLDHELIMRKLKNYGDIYFVDATSGGIGSDSHKGTKPSAPLLTLEEGIDRLTDWGNDVIIHKGYENVAAGITMDKNKASIFGWGLFGANKYFPETGSFCRTVAEAAPVLTIDAEFVEIAGLAFAAEWVTDNIRGQSALSIISGANKVHVHHCFFPDWDYASQTAGLNIDGAHYTVIEDCEFHSLYANIDDGIIVTSGPGQPAFTRIRRSKFFGAQGAVGAMAVGIREQDATWQQFGIEHCDFINVTNALLMGGTGNRWAYAKHCVGTMAAADFLESAAGDDDTIGHATTGWGLTLADIWGSDGPLTS